MLKKISMFLIVFLLLAACSNEENKEEGTEQKSTEPVELTISAAASLKDAMEEIQHTYKEKHPEVMLNFNFGGSGSLQQQISQGAPVDLFFSAADDKFDLLVEEGLIAKEDGADLLSNELVLIVPKEGQVVIQSFQDLAKDTVSQLSIGTPETVPAGKYAKESFEKVGIWNDVEPKIVFAKDVRQVLSYVETGNVQAGVVYKTDALTSDKVTIVASADSASHSPIIYPVGVIKDSKHYEAAKEFYAFLQSEKILKVFEDYGFTIE